MKCRILLVSCVGLIGISMAGLMAQQTGTRRRTAEGSGRASETKSGEALSVASLRVEYDRLDAKSAALAQQIRELLDARGPQDPEVATRKADLRRVVAAAFSAGQRLHQAEIIEFQQRMRRLEETIERRQRNPDQIIDRRVEDLLNPELKWERPAHGDSTGRVASPSQITSANTSAAEASITDGGAKTVQPAEIESPPKKFKPYGTLDEVGVVSEVGADGRIEISCKEPGGIRIGEELNLYRPKGGSSVGWVVVVAVQDRETVIARVTELGRTLRENKYVRDTAEPGNSVLRPNYLSDAEILQLEITGMWKIDFSDFGGVKAPGVGIRDAFIRFRANGLPEFDAQARARTGRDALQVPNAAAIRAFLGGKFEAGEGSKTTRTGTFRVDTTRSPAQIDLDGKYQGERLQQFGICKFEDDILVVCLAQNEAERPDSFTPKDGRTLLKLARIENPPFVPGDGANVPSASGRSPAAAEPSAEPVGNDTKKTVDDRFERGSGDQSERNPE